MQQAHTEESLRRMGVSDFISLAMEILGSDEVRRLEEEYDKARKPIEDAILKKLEGENQ